MMKVRIQLTIFFTTIFFPFIILAQNNHAIFIENPSYEGYPRHNSTAEGWFYCGFGGESPPDIQPGTFGVDNSAKDGNSYAGMVTRDNSTFENLKFNLSEPTKKGQCYEWIFFISQSKKYESISRTTLEKAMFDFPVNVVIYGSAKKASCKKMDELARYENVHDMNKWTGLKIQFKTEKVYNSIVVSVQPRNIKKPTNGHILLDYFHPIIELNCEQEDSLTFNLPIKKDFLSFLDTLLSKEVKVQELVKKIDFDFLYKHLYLEYQLYMVTPKSYRYDNVYLDELIRLFPDSDNDELLLLFKMRKKKYLDASAKNSTLPNISELNRTVVIGFLQKYMKQRNINGNVKILEWTKENEQEYQDYKIESAQEAVDIFIKN